jgi:branched-chain amino acid transport system substrate-binding protein
LTGGAGLAYGSPIQHSAASPAAWETAGDDETRSNREEQKMKTRKPGPRGAANEQRRGPRLDRRAFAAGAAATALVAGAAPFNIVRSQAQSLKIGMLLPRSGFQALLGQACQRGADLAPAVLREFGYDVKIELMNADTESKVDKARTEAEKLVNEGAHVLIGAFDSGQSAAIAQVAEQRRVPYVINIAAAPQITEQGYKYVFRNFPTGPMLVRDGLSLMKELFRVTGKTPKTAVFMHVNDTFGTSMKAGIDALFPRLEMPFKIVETIAYDPQARDLSVEVAKAKATGAELLMPVTRLNDAILLIREMVKQRWEPMGIVTPGSPGMYENQFYKALGKYSDFCISNVPWYNPRERMAQTLVEAFNKAHPKEIFELNVGFTFEAVLIAADALKRAGTSNADKMADALRATKIDRHVMVGGPIAFDAKGQNVSIRSVALQNINRAPTVVLPLDVAAGNALFPMPGWQKRA